MLRRTSDRKRKITGRTVGALLAAMLMSCLAVMNITASEEDRMPDITPGLKGSLEVTMQYTDPNLETDNIKPMPGVQVKLAQVASLETHGGSADYTLLEAYKSTGIELAGMTASQSNEAAQKLAPLATGSDVKTAAAASDGTVVFSDLEPGIYLVFQEKDANTSYRVDAIATFLISVPFPAKQEDGNLWQYEVEVTPKTEIEGPKNNGVIRVTKSLYNTETELSYNPPENEEIVFYVGLFTDEACTVRAAGTTDMPLRFLNSDTATAVFENLTTDMTYYIAETDGQGNVVPSAIQGDDVLFEALYPNGQSVSITRFEPEGEITFQNATRGLPQNYYYGGTLTITKKTLLDGMDYKTNRVFYAGVFTDANFTELYTVVKLSMDGKSSVSVPLEVNIGQSVRDSATYYITETDKDGKPLGSGQEFTFTINKEGGKVELSPSSPDDEVIITNKFTESEEETEIETEVSTEKGTIRTPRTGDDTPIMLYLALMAIALVVILLTGGAVIDRRRK